MKKHIHIGTSGWSYPEWRGLFYPRGAQPGAYLPYYATQFDCVELNASFYRIPSAEYVTRWREQTPSEFRLCPKLYRGVTHVRKLIHTEREMNMFFKAFGIPGTKMGPVLIQLPSVLEFNALRMEEFFAMLGVRYAPYHFAVEARHVSWWSDKALSMLERYRVANVLADSGGHFPSSSVVTTDMIYVRFHGAEELYASSYSPAFLLEYADRIRQWESEGREVWVFFNNTKYGHAIANARELRDILQQDRQEEQ